MPHSGLSFRSLCLFALMALVVDARAALADSSEGDLASVLNEVAGEADVEILFSPDLVAGKQPGSIATEGSPEEVLSRVLSGTGLTVEQTSPRVYVVRETQAQAGESTEAPPPQATTPPPQTSNGNRNGFGSIEGRVVDDSTGTGLAGATVRVRGTDLSAVTDQRGFYRLSAVPSGRVDIEVVYIGADPGIQTVDLDNNETAVTNIGLALSALDTLVVYGNRSGFLQALNQQKNAENNKTVVSADLLGTFPAETVAEALRRLPGVTFVLDDATGEGNKVSVRGITPEGINIQVNGMQLQGTGIERAVDLNGFLADNISQITIQKSLLPEYEATGNGGLIEIETKSALDYGQRYFSVGAEHEFGEDGDFGDETQFNLSAVGQFTDRFAMGINAQYRETDRQNLNVTYSSTLPPVLPEGYTSLFTMPFTFNFPFDAAIDDRLVSNANYLNRNRDVETTNASLFAAWDIGDTTRLRAEYQRIDNEDFSTLQRSTNQILTGSTDMPIPELGGETRRRTYLRALRPTNGVTETDASTTTDVFSLRGESFMNRWTFNYDAGLTRTENDSLGYTINTLSDQNTDLDSLLDGSSLVINPDGGGTDRIVNGGFRIVGDQIPALNLSPAGQAYVYDPDTYYITSATENQRTNETDNLTLRFKAQYDFSGEHLRNVKFGVQHNDIDRENSDDVLSNTNIPTSLSYVRLGSTRQLLSSFSGNPFTLLDLGGVGANGVFGAALGQGSAGSIFQQIAEYEAANPGSYRLTDNLVSPEDSASAISTGKVNEQLTAGFVQGEVDLGLFTITGGVRAEYGDYTGTAISSPSVRDDSGTFIERNVMADAGLISVYDNSGSTENFLPSLVATWRPDDRWVGRFAYNRTIFNPSVSAINRPQQFIVDLRPTFNRATIREGNPDLDPTVNDNFEIGMEYYVPGRVAYAKAAVFYKDIKDNITNVNLADVPADIEDRVRDFLSQLEPTVPGLVDGLNDQTEYLLQRPVNGDGGSIHGIELEGATNLDFFPDSWPDFLNNIQILGNITWTDADFPTLVSARDENGDTIQLTLNRPLAEQSEWAGNASIAYEAGRFSGRLLYTYQSERVEAYDEFNLNTVVPEIKTLDLITTYTIDWGGARYFLFLEADNLLDSHTDALVQRGTGSYGGEGSPDFFFPNSLLFDGGRTFTLGVKAQF